MIDWNPEYLYRTIFPDDKERNWFDGCLVSGEEGIRKPSPEIYQRLISRFNIRPEETMYVDDNLRNVLPARELGFYGIHFRSPQQFRQELIELGVITE